jgi:hypothetical protein
VADYEEKYGRGPGNPAYLRQIAQRWEVSRVRTAFAEEYARDPNPRTIFSRMETGLKEGDHRLTNGQPKEGRW